MKLSQIALAALLTLGTNVQFDTNSNSLELSVGISQAEAGPRKKAARKAAKKEKKDIKSAIDKCIAAEKAESKEDASGGNSNVKAKVKKKKIKRDCSKEENYNQYL
jgi:hypothetical protein